MAAARHNCAYLVRRQQDAFLAHGGNPEWLQGLDAPSLPPRLTALAELNALLAHRPWLINKARVDAGAAGAGEGRERACRNKKGKA